MDKIIPLNSVLIPLQLTSLQFFDFSSLKSSQISPFTATKFKIFFTVTFPIYTVIAGSYYILGFMKFEDVSSAHNFLQYEFKIITYFGRFLIIFTGMLESFLSTWKVKKIFIDGFKISKILEGEFRDFSHKKYEELKSVMIRRLVVSSALISLLELLPLSMVENPFENLTIPLSKLFGTAIISLLIYKFCFYVDFINLNINVLAVVLGKNFHGNLR